MSTSTSPEPRYVIHAGWLCVETDGCNCSGGFEFPHEPHCQLEPCIRVDDIQSALAERDALRTANRALLDRVQAAEADALNRAADEVRHTREHGLRPGEKGAPYAKHFEDWLRARAAVGTGQADEPQRPTVEQWNRWQPSSYPDTFNAPTGQVVPQQPTTEAGIWACNDLGHDVGFRHEDGSLYSATCHTCGIAYRRPNRGDDA